MNHCNINHHPGSPPSFSCYKTESHHSESKIHYSDCTIATPGMDPDTGTFTVQEPGVYQFTFTGFIVSLKGHMVSESVYMYWESSVHSYFGNLRQEKKFL